MVCAEHVHTALLPQGYLHKGGIALLDLLVAQSQMAVVVVRGGAHTQCLALRVMPVPLFSVLILFSVSILFSVLHLFSVLPYPPFLFYPFFLFYHSFLCFPSFLCFFVAVDWLICEARLIGLLDG